MKTRLYNLRHWLTRIGASLRRAIGRHANGRHANGRHAKHKCAPQPWRGGLVI